MTDLSDLAAGLTDPVRKELWNGNAQRSLLAERVKIQEGHVPPVHDLPGFYPSVEPRHARPETLGPDTPSKGSRNPSFTFSAIL